MVHFLSGPSAIGRSLTAPPGVPAERLAVLRKAFDDMIADPQFRAEAERGKIEITPVRGVEAQATIEGFAQVDQGALALAKKVVPDHD